MRGPFKLMSRDPKTCVLQEVQNDVLEVGGNRRVGVVFE